MAEETVKNILFDTDLGDDVDDAAALIMALNSPELNIVGITTVFKDTWKRAEMVLELCEMYGRKDIPVYAGCSTPIIERLDIGEAPIQYEILERVRTQEVHNELDAPDFIIQEVKRDPDLILVVMGAMTNIGVAFHRAPDIMQYANIIAMGGVFSSSSPEWNIKCDPEAVRLVLDYAQHMKMFGLEVTKHCFVSDEMMDEICPADNPRMQYFKKGAEVFRRKTGYVYTFHDALLTAYLLEPEIVNLKQSDFNVELAGENTRGAIVFKTNAYDLHTEVEKDFYYAETMNVDKFRKIVKERMY